MSFIPYAAVLTPFVVGLCALAVILYRDIQIDLCRQGPIRDLSSLLGYLRTPVPMANAFIFSLAFGLTLTAYFALLQLTPFQVQ